MEMEIDKSEAVCQSYAVVHKLAYMQRSEWRQRLPLFVQPR